jgi:CRP-like cAMP-binding protein
MLLFRCGIGTIRGAPRPDRPAFSQDIRTGRMEGWATMPETRAHFRAGTRIYAAGAPGEAWRVLSGSVRLDRPGDAGQASMFANLAVAGDVIGAETLLFQHYTFEATALSECTLAPWPEGREAPARESLLAALTSSERRSAEVVALRCGQAVDRVVRLLRLIAGGQPQLAGASLPARRDMAEITALTTETVSRIVSRLRRSGALPASTRRGGRQHAA